MDTKKPEHEKPEHERAEHEKPEYEYGYVPEKEKGDKGKSSIDMGLEALGFVFQLGLTMAVPILLGVLLGNWLDRQFDAGKIFFFLLAGLGVFLGFYIAYRQIIPSKKRKEKMDRW